MLGLSGSWRTRFLMALLSELGEAASLCCLGLDRAHEVPWRRLGRGWDRSCFVGDAVEIFLVYSGLVFYFLGVELVERCLYDSQLSAVDICKGVDGDFGASDGVLSAWQWFCPEVVVECDDAVDS